MEKQQRKKKVKKVSRGGRGGRPRLDDAERRSGRINVPVNDEEKMTILNKATIYHMKGAYFLREVGLGHYMRRPIPQINYEAHRELGRMGANLNRAIVLMNERRDVGISQEFAQQLYDLLQSTRRALLGVENSDRQD